MRSLFKPVLFDQQILRKVKKIALTPRLSKYPIKTCKRYLPVLNLFNTLTFKVHAGKRFYSLIVVQEMVGEKLGSFAPTRSIFKYIAKKKKKKKTKK